MTKRSSWRVSGGIAGIVFAVGAMVVAVFLFGAGPKLDDSMTTIRDYFTNDAPAHFIFVWIGTLVYVFGLLPFASSLRSLFSADDVDAGVWSRLSFVGAVLAVALAGVGTLFWSMLALDGGGDVPDGVVLALMNGHLLVFGAIVPWGFALFAIGASAVVLRTGILWRWLGWLGLGAATLMLLGTFWVLDGDPEGPLGIVGYIGFFATLLWSLLAGYALMSTEESA
jgi:hypothetical protein